MSREEEIQRYAKSLVKHKIKDSMDEALAESRRWFNKRDKGFEEPLPCPTNPDITWTVEDTPTGKIVHYSWPIDARQKDV